MEEAAMAPGEAPKVLTLRLDETIGEARDAMRRAASGVALIVNGPNLAGVVTIDDVEDDALDPSAQLASAVDKEIVLINPQADDLHTLKVYRDAAWQSLRRRAIERSAT